MTQYINKAAVVAEIEKRINEIDEFGTYLSPKGTLTNLLCHLDTLEVKEMKEEPISNNMEYASEKYACRFSSSKYGHDKVKDAFIAGAQWQKEHLWKPSEEQMKALNTCIMQGEISYVGQGPELQSLYNDLKKLTE